MARRDRERRDVRRTFPREVSTFAYNPVRAFTVRSYNPLSDLRVFNFERPTRAFVSIGPRSAARIMARGPSPVLSAPHRLGFRDPSRVDVCKRRKERRRALLATGNGGRNRRGRKGPFSDISC